VEGVDRGTAVLAERDRPQRPEADGVGAIDVDEVEWVDHVSERLRDLAIVQQEVAVDEELLRHLVARGQEQRRPVDAVKAQDVLAQEVVDVRPELVAQVLAFARVCESAQVVDEGVYPDIGHLPLVPGDRYAPRLPGPADAEVLESALDEAASLVVAKARQHEVWPLVVEGK
jgi:hypothetical protein